MSASVGEVSIHQVTRSRRCASSLEKWWVLANFPIVREIPAVAVSGHTLA